MNRWIFVLQRLTLAAGLLLPVAGAAHAQTPTVLIHGFASNEGTWDVAQVRIANDFSATVHRRSTNWNDSYEDQAGQINDSFGGLSSDAVAIGHSNGGIIARQWSQSRALDGVVTIGTPHQGAPLLANWYFVYLKAASIGNSVWNVISGVQNCWNCNYGSWQWIFYDVLDIGDYVTGWIWQVATAVLFQILPTGTVVQEMIPFSNYLTHSLNASAGIAAEAQNVSTRVGIQSWISPWGGPFRLFGDGFADALATSRDILNVLMDGYAAYIFLTADPNLNDYYDSINLAWAMVEASYQLWTMDYAWCRDVSWASYSFFYGDCQPNDGLVPDSSQVFPNASVNVVVPDGAAHIAETSSGRVYDALYYVLSELIHVPPSGGPPPPPPPPPGGGMQPDSAVRGCSDYVEWSPVYRDSAESCLSYCQENNADSCEWHVGGSCYVEFGNGCYVQGGFSGWYAWVR